MPGPLPVDLRERVMEALDNGEGTLEELAERFSIRRNSILQWRRLRDETGSLRPRPMGGARPRKKRVDAAGEAWLRDTLNAKPALTHKQLVALYHEQFGLELPVETMRSTVKRLGYTHKKGLSGRSTRGDRTSSPRETPSEPR